MPAGRGGATGDGRFEDAVFCANGPRAYLTNNVDLNDEPPPLSPIDPSQFLKMVRGMFGVVSDVHFKALIKRTMLLVGGKNGLYFRMPEESLDAPVIRYTEDNVVSDWLVDTNKAYLSKYKDLPPLFFAPPTLVLHIFLSKYQK